MPWVFGIVSSLPEQASDLDRLGKQTKQRGND